MTEESEHKVLYRCTGTCGGVSPEPKECGAADCTMAQQSLTPVEQCDGCAAASAQDGQPHACEKCMRAET